MTEDLSSETLADESRTSSADGGETVESPALKLDELNTYLGSDFKDTSTALKALKDTKDFVGKRKEDIAAEVRASLIPAPSTDVATKSDVQSLKDELFFSQNPQYKGHEALLKSIARDPAEAVNNESFKSLFEKAQVADEVANNKSVVSSNGRLSQAKSVVEQAIQVTNARGSTNEDTALVFASAINAANNER